MFVLALALGVPLQTVMEMPAADFQAWQAYYTLFPFGDRRGDLQAGIVSATVANVNRSKTTPLYNAADFMPRFGEAPPTPDEIMAEKITRFMRKYH